MTTAYIALGSNLGDSEAHLEQAADALNQLPDTRVTATSRLFRTPPWGPIAQPPFLNAVVAVETGLSPHALLASMLGIERAAGRIRDQRWGPRTLDLDLLHMEGVSLHDEVLTLPHPRIAERAFVLLPLNDVAPNLVIPGQGVVADLLAVADQAGCEVIP
ncbi:MULTISPECIES: 2-amino-4-hydroxy-6-hydroxymethyldihydropteridine diphosphokinase [Dyella]|uniref:2-amino-4-hydroxy-6-hydroxymethyldihydropteridine pyrophosphokinase n=2 Tax=Dyella TaxID=231454 RepID=A0A4V2NMI2_9GAMM|nr:MULTISPECIES: 2-amino-4-hydroxy-6-hydroxymethyldihydropteridine diphosphokinase [Dyella]TBR39011.1 2-amino-4-hydroxy-6-hydroxymethyldihydropteridine diphosphokinase [Dyella terrae]TCI13397.1 2-amino-4-hydroxy-6-hydroxymethyldihydropteridine diphosphokinase [Dyella soli]